MSELAHLVAYEIARGDGSPERHELAKLIGEITLRTSLTGAGTLTVTVADPEWKLFTSGWLDTGHDGIFKNEIEVQFPPGRYWRLCMVDIDTDLSTQNLTLTFEDRSVAYLRDKWGPKHVRPGTTTRAQFIHQLVAEVGRGDRLTPIRFVCPSIDVVQRIARSSTDSLGTTTIRTGSDSAAAGRRTNKQRGVGHGAPVTAKGVPLDAGQIAEVNTILDVADKLHAGYVATTAAICAAIGESWIGRQPGSFAPNSYGYWGVFQGGSGQNGSAANFPDPHDTAGQARSFFLGGKGFQAGGAIKLAREGTGTQNLAPGAIATMVEASGEPADFYGRYMREAWAIIDAYGGLRAGSQSADALNAAVVAARPKSDVTQLMRGTPDNPDEDSWDCISRLAQEVTWYAFSNGNTLYYMDGPDLVAQTPRAFLSRDPDREPRWALTDGHGREATAIGCVDRLSGTIDNSSFVYHSTHRRKGKMRRAARIAKPSTPTSIQLNLICDLDYAHAGDVFVLVECGSLNGRWIITDATRNCIGDRFTQFTLGPPTAPSPEPQATTDGTGATTTPTGTGVGNSNAAQGALAGVVAAAKRALAERSKYVYSEGADRGNGGTLFGPEPRTMDCSAFATLCYKAAGLPDPNHMDYSPIGTTFSFFPHCTKVANPQPGDVCFFGTAPNAASTMHMSVYIGNGQVINMGGPGEPKQGPAEDMGPGRSLFLGYYRPDVVT